LSCAASTQLLQIYVERFDEIADAVIGAVGRWHQLRDSGADHDLTLGSVETHQVEMLQRIGQLLLEGSRQIAPDCNRIGRDRIGLPEKYQIASL
jgi:hypothetical protein